MKKTKILKKTGCAPVMKENNSMNYYVRDVKSIVFFDE